MFWLWLSRIVGTDVYSLTWCSTWRGGGRYEFCVFVSLHDQGHSQFFWFFVRFWRHRDWCVLFQDPKQTPLSWETASEHWEAGSRSSPLLVQSRASERLKTQAYDLMCVSKWLPNLCNLQFLCSVMLTRGSLNHTWTNLPQFLCPQHTRGGQEREKTQVWQNHLQSGGPPVRQLLSGRRDRRQQELNGGVGMRMTWTLSTACLHSWMLQQKVF